MTTQTQITERINDMKWQLDLLSAWRFSCWTANGPRYKRIADGATVDISHAGYWVYRCDTDQLSGETAVGLFVAVGPDQQPPVIATFGDATS